MKKVLESIFVVNSLYCFTTVHEWGSVEMYTCSNTALGRKRKNRWFCFFIFTTPRCFFPSVDTVCASMFSLGSEGLNIRPPRVALPSAVFTCLLVCVLYSDNCRGYASLKGASELTPCGLMIAWASGWRASKLCMWPCRNRSWRLPLRALRHRMWDSPNMLTI